MVITINQHVAFNEAEQLKLKFTNRICLYQWICNYCLHMAGSNPNCLKCSGGGINQ